MRRLYVLALFGLWANVCLFAQTDILTFNDNELVKGEMKGMKKGIVTIETSYSDDDFTIEWDGVKSISTETKFLTTLKDGTKYYGTLISDDKKQVVIADEDQGDVVVSLMDIVELSSVEEDFWERISANVDVGFDMAKSRNLRTFTTNANVGYKAESWNTSASYNTLRSNQDDVDEIKRWEGQLAFNYILGRKWYPNAMIQWLSNTEQQLDLRQNAQLGIGVYLIRSNKAYWGVKFGVNNNYERYYTYDSSEQPVKTTTDNTSWEGFMATEVDLFDMGDLSFYTLVTTYFGITEKGRWRTDASLNCKYDLPLDFYVKMGVSLNHDNKPAEGASESDYVFSSGFGWEW